MKKKNSIVKKLIITFTSITGGVLILVGLIISLWFFKSSELENRKRIDAQLDMLKISINNYINEQDSAYEEINDLLKMVSIGSNVDIMVIDRLGYIYMVSDSIYDTFKYTKVDIPNNIDEYKLYNQEIEGETGEKIKVTAYFKPLYTYDKVNGYFAIIDKNTIKDIFDGSNMIIIVWLSIILAMGISVIIVTYSSQKLVIKPLEEINNAAKRLTIGDVKKRVNIQQENEIGELANSFNIMAESIEKADVTRKEFVSNVSHELRSPITSIKGFVGGILDGIIPKDRENYYLKIVYDEVNRLARLVNDLLDMSAMESGKFKLDISEFDVNQVIKLCILNLENKAKDKGLTVKCTLFDERCFVAGDRDRIIQVITNLIENAIKYSYDNGQIEVKAKYKGEKVIISIFNTGPTIKEDEINNIWDRFYKSDKSRTNKISTGLGLPIVRIILSQHNEDIAVENIDKQGVRFTFTLRRVS